MTKTYWKRIVPHSMVKALNLTKEHGKENKQQSVQRIADRLSISQDCLYKWLGDATMPVKSVIAFEEVCGISFVTQYLAHSQGFLLVKAPTGRKAEHRDLIDLQAFMIEVSGLIMRHTEGLKSAQETTDAIKALMEDLAFHHKNVNELDKPQTELSLVNDQ